MSDYTQKPYSMICGSAEAEQRKYKKIPCARGVWLVAIQPNEADNVYFHNPNDKNSQGFAGRTLSFPLEDGSVYEAKGPWHGNSESLFKDTGYDCRDKHLTFIVLSKERTMNANYQTVMKDVVYQDEKPTLGSFYRYKELIKQYPEAKMYYSESTGGSSCGPTKNEI